MVKLSFGERLIRHRRII